MCVWTLGESLVSVVSVQLVANQCQYVCSCVRQSVLMGTVLLGQQLGCLKGITRLFVSLTVMAELSGGVLESIPLNINAITDSHFIRNWALNLCH